MTQHSPLAYKVRMTIALLAAGLIIVMLLARHLLSAIGPVKTVFFNIGLIGLLGMLLVDIICIGHVILRGKGKIDLWIAIPGAIFSIMGLGGALLNTLLS